MENNLKPIQEHQMRGKSDVQMQDQHGALPAHAPLAYPFVANQQEDPTQYSAKYGIIRGTLFPGLDLPFHGMVNKRELSQTPLHELQALKFAIQELALYLDTHPGDTEAAELLQCYNELFSKGKQEYTQRFGPLDHLDAVQNGKYRWLQGPWPWEYCGNQED